MNPTDEIKFSPDPAEISALSKEKLPALVIQGLQLFNAREFFEAHEILEEAWRAERRPIRELYRGILQVGVACYHAQRNNFTGAVKMFQRSKIWLKPFPDICCGINLAQFRTDYQIVEDQIKTLGPGNLERFNPGLLKPIFFT